MLKTGVAIGKVPNAVSNLTFLLVSPEGQIKIEACCTLANLAADNDDSRLIGKEPNTIHEL